MDLLFFFTFLVDWIESSESELSEIIVFVLVFGFFVCIAVVTNAVFLKRDFDGLFATGLAFWDDCVFRGISVKLVLPMYGELSDFACFSLKKGFIKSIGLPF